MSLVERDRRPPWVAALRGRLAVLGAHAALAVLALTGGPAGRAVALAGVGVVAFLAYRARRVRLFALAGTGAATAGALLLVAAHLGHDAGVHRPADVAEVLGSVLLLPAGLIAAGLAATLVGRALRRPARWGWVEPGRNVVPPASVLDRSGRPFPGDALPTPRPDRDLGRPPAELGICASGGGIRSAAVTLGALQRLRAAGLLARARYLVSVSGGGFTAGAFQLAMQPLPTLPDDEHRTGTAVTDPAEVFAEGSVEEDHVRRHGKYVADSGGEWVEALGAVLRGAGASLALLAGVVCSAGVILGEFYRRTPVASFDYGYPFTPGAGDRAPGLPEVPEAVLLAAGLPLLVGVLAWFGNIAMMSFLARASRAGRLVVGAAFALAGLVLVLGVGVPVLVWVGTRAVWWVDSMGSVNAAQLVTGGAAGTVTLAYLGSLGSILWRGRKHLAGVTRLTRRLPGALGRRLAVWSVLIAIGALYATLLGAVVRSSSQHGPHWLVLAGCAGFVLVTVLVDETWMSLHWFYRRRLMSAFAVRRVRLGEECDAALPYDFEREATPLSVYGARVEGFPQVIFSAAAHLSGADRSPPGRDAVSFSFSGDWVGGPQVGYVRTPALETNLGGNLRMDLTVQTAVAVSGAAFASSMGVQARAYQTLLALSNARLGTWLPNPAWLYRRCPAGGCAPDWTAPRLPRVRRISYLLREVLGRYDQHDRLLLVTDGGHYDNTGLVELLRHRCRTVVLIDSSGDPPPFAQALGRAIGLARGELGVTVELDDGFALVPGGGDPLEPGPELAGVSGRLSRSAVLTGSITYPSAFTAPGEEAPSAVGRLVVAKLALTADMPYDVLAFAAANPAFPFDPTGDQWFDEEQFNGYHAIGRVLGEKAAAAVLEPAVKVPGPRLPEPSEVRVT